MLYLKHSISLTYFVLLVFLSLLDVISARRSSSEQYRGYKVFRVNSTSTVDAEKLSCLFDHLNADVWRHPSSLSPFYDVMISRKSLKSFEASMEETDSNFSVFIDDVGQLIRKTERRPRLHRKRHLETFRYDEYHKYRDIYKWMRSFSRKNKDLLSMIPVGITSAGKNIWGLKIRTNKRITKKVLWQDSLIHSREWVTGATLLWITNRLVEGYRAGEREVVHLLNNLDFILVPVWNVDGYIYTWRSNRLWRKSRSKSGSVPNCRGVDLNRNFKTPIRGSGTTGATSDYICSGVYQGASPFSEPETDSVSDFLGTLDLAAFVTVHSFAQLWLYPYGYTTERSFDHSDLESLSREAVQAMESVHQTEYNHGPISSTVYKVSGGSSDWAHRTLCVKYSFAVELRDTGDFGFMLPPEDIIPTAEEYYAGLVVVAKHVIAANSTRSSFCTDDDSQK